MTGACDEDRDISSGAAVVIGAGAGSAAGVPPDSARGPAAPSDLVQSEKNHEILNNWDTMQLGQFQCDCYQHARNGKLGRKPKDWT